MHPSAGHCGRLFISRGWQQRSRPLESVEFEAAHAAFPAISDAVTTITSPPARRAPASRKR